MKKYLLLILVALSACSEKIRVYTDADSARDIRSYSTFTWDEVKNLEAKNNPLFYNELNDKRIKKEVNTKLKDHAYKLVEKDAHLIVHYHIVIKNETVYRDLSNVQHGATWLDSQSGAYSLNEGTLIIDFMDAKTNELIWRGYAISILDEYRPDISEKTIKEAITKIFAAFPYSQ